MSEIPYADPQVTDDLEQYATALNRLPLGTQTSSPLNNQSHSDRSAARFQLFAVCVLLLTAGMHPASVLAQTPDARQTETMDAASEVGLPGEVTPPDGSAETVVQEPVAREAAKTPVSETVDPWEAFFPPPDSGFDWLQLTSGEWLKGEIKGFYNFELEFESDKLKSLKFDWDKVKSLRSAGPQAVRYSDTTGADEPYSAFANFTLAREPQPLTAFGQLTLIGNTATIGASPNLTTIDRDQILTIAKGTQKEADFWSGKLGIGANIRSGNSDVADAALTFLAERRKAESRFHVDYRGNFSETAGIETQNNHRINTFFDSFRTSRMYWRIVFAEYFRDKFQNIQNQLTIGTGIGYDITRTQKTEWDISAGIGALYKQAVSVEAGNDAGNTSPALTLGTTFDTELTSRLDYYIKYSVRVVDEENGSIIQNAVTTLSSDITGNLDLDLTLTWDRTEDPQPKSDGTVPDRDDFRFTVSIAYDF